jgi:hypothetical protein
MNKACHGNGKIIWTLVPFNDIQGKSVPVCLRFEEPVMGVHGATRVD